MISATKYTPADFTIKKLDGSIDLSEFNCSENDDLGLHEFLHKEALDYQNEGMGATYLFYKGSKIAGYITVAMGSISVNSAKSAKAMVNVRNYDKVRYPAILLGRVAVDNKFRRKAVGSFMCDWCVGLAQQLATDIGCRFIVLITKAESRVRFYERCGFQECLISKSESLVPIEQRHRMMLSKADYYHHKTRLQPINSIAIYPTKVNNTQIHLTPVTEKTIPQQVNRTKAQYTTN